MGRGGPVTAGVEQDTNPAVASRTIGRAKYKATLSTERRSGCPLPSSASGQSQRSAIDRMFAVRGFPRSVRDVRQDLPAVDQIEH